MPSRAYERGSVTPIRDRPSEPSRDAGARRRLRNNRMNVEILARSDRDAAASGGVAA